MRGLVKVEVSHQLAVHPEIVEDLQLYALKLEPNKIDRVMEEIKDKLHLAKLRENKEHI